MTAKQWTPDAIAEYDQLMAAAGEKLDAHVAKLREQLAKHGVQQGISNYSLFLTKFGDADLYLDLLVPAMLRLATTEEAP